MADIRLPGVGPVSKKWVVIVLAGSAATIGYIVIRKRSANAAAASTATDTGTTDTSTIDPLTGDIAGSAQDQADLAAMQAGGYGNSLGGYGTYGGEYVETPPGTQLPGAGGFTTNGEWAQQAEQDLGGLGIDEATLSAALGAYLTGRTLTAGQQSLTDQAIAEEGYPPVAGPGGYPPAMKTGGGGGGGGTQKPGTPKLQAATDVTTTTATVHWDKVTGATSYAVALAGRAPATVSGTSHTIAGLKPKNSYTYHVAARNSAGAGPEATGTFQTREGRPGK